MQRGFVINGETADDLVGMSISSAGDVNGDGLDDLIPAQETEGPKEPLSSLIVSLLIRKPPMPEAIADKSMAVPSVNGDGLDDLIVGASYADPSGKPGAGKSYIVFGKADSSAIDLSVIDKIYLHLIYHLDRQYKHLKSNHPSHRH
jgi:hypothetical protein